MSKVWSLIKVISKDLLGSFKLKKNEKLIYLILIIALASLFIPILIGSWYLGDLLQNNSWYVVKLIIPMVIILVLITSIFSNLSTFFLSKDIQYFLSLPLKPWQILLAKIICSLIVPWIIEIVLLLPILLGVGVGTGYGVLFYFFTIIGIILLPVVPSCLTAIIICSLMRFSNIAKSKDRLTYIIYTVLLVFILTMVIGLQFYMNSRMSDIAVVGDDLMKLYGNMGELIENIIIIAKPLNTALTDSNILISILNIFIFIICNLFLLGLFLLIGEKVYLKAVISGKQKGNKNKENQLISQKVYKKKNVLWTYALKEWRILYRTPMFNLNLILIIFLMPIIMIASLAATYFALDEASKSLFSNIKIESNNLGASLLLIGALLFMGSMTMISATAISRDGKNAFFIKAIPVPVITQIHAKMFWGVVFSIGTSLFILIPLVIFSFINVLGALVVFIAFIAINVFLNYIEIFLDTKRPKLNWTSEQAAVKQNFNAVIVLLTTMVIASLLLILGFMVIEISFTGAIYIVSSMLTIIFSILSFVMYKYFTNPNNNIFKNVS